MSFMTADLFDHHGQNLQVAEPMLRDFGGKVTFNGPIATVKVFEDNTLVRQSLEQPGDSRVLVIDGGGSLRCALVGDQIAALALNSGWSGLVVYGCIRDSAEIGELEMGVKALNTNPAKSVKRGEGQLDINVRFAGVDFIPGHHIYADRDGIVVSQTALANPV